MRILAPVNFKSACGRYGVSFEATMFEKMLHECMTAGCNETGGILWGMYSDNLDNAIVTGFSKAPSDSISSRFSFQRGVIGLQHLLQSLWKKTNREYYLGEWHFHPFSSSMASSIDIQQMFAHANNRRLQCPEPIMIIIGGNPCCEWSVNITVYTREDKVFNLIPMDTAWQNMFGTASRE